MAAQSGRMRDEGDGRYNSGYLSLTLIDKFLTEETSLPPRAGSIAMQ